MPRQQEILDLGSGFFTISDIAEILKVDRHKISYLVRNYWNDKLSSNRNFIYIYETDKVLAVNFYALIEIKVFYVLKENGISYKKALEAHNILSKEFNTNYPFAHNSFYQSGSTILFEKGKSLIQAENSKQIAIRQVIEPFSEKIDYSTDKIARAYYPLGKDKDIIVDPEHQFGEPVVVNTNILASTISKMYNAGDKVELIAKVYNIKETAVKDAIAYFNKKAA